MPWTSSAARAHCTDALLRAVLAAAILWFLARTIPHVATAQEASPSHQEALVLAGVPWPLPTVPCFPWAAHASSPQRSRSQAASRYVGSGLGG